MNPKEALIQSLIGEGYLKTPEIIQAFRAVDRADFVLPEYKEEAYGNYPLPIGEGQTISQPLTVAFMLELLQPRPGEKILDAGSGSGWTTALLAQIAGSDPTIAVWKRVVGIERIPEICEFGKKNLAKYFDESKAKIICADGTKGLPEDAPFDKILAGAAASCEIPETWRNQLKIGGKIVAPVSGSVWLFVKKSEKEWEEKEFPGFAFVPLVKESGNYRSPTSILKSDFDRFIKKPKRNWFVILLVACLMSLVAIAANEIYLPHSRTDELKRVEVNQGLGPRKIAKLLKEEGIIRSQGTFIFYVAVKGVASKLKPGTYAFGKKAISGIARDLVKGTNYERVITIPEGWNLREITLYMRRQELPFGTDFETVAQDREMIRKLSEKFSFLKEIPAPLGLEGYLFPDTYRVFQDSDSEQVLTKMLENFDQKSTSDLREEISRQKKTLFEIITMASLIEEEVVSEEDRATVSGILWKRLEAGIPLQVDATIAYIKNQESRIKNQRNGKISTEDTKIDSPYNTYLYRGLPTGPISNPGISAIKAAIFPQKSPYLYYLSAQDGKTIFSRTLEEHNMAKGKYLK